MFILNFTHLEKATKVHFKVKEENISNPPTKQTEPPRPPKPTRPTKTPSQFQPQTHRKRSISRKRYLPRVNRLK
jgi:hypothetical protein